MVATQKKKVGTIDDKVKILIITYNNDFECKNHAIILGSTQI